MHWRCWQCKRIYSLEDHCAVCELIMSSYTGNVEEILEEVKVSRPQNLDHKSTSEKHAEPPEELSKN